MTEHEPSSTTDDDSPNLKLLVKILLVLGIAIPVVIEGFTFASLFQQELFGDNDPAGTPTPTPTPGVDRVGPGDELLAATPQSERVTTQSLRAQNGQWVFTLSVAVNNSAATDYQLQLLSVTTSGGNAVSNAEVVQLGPGEQGAVTGRWALPAGEYPRSVTVVAVTGDGQNSTTIRREVALERVPVDN